MKCPQCDVPLLIADRHGVEIDYCSQCRGVWLDRGELDKIIDLSVRDQRRGNSGYGRPPPEYGGYHSERAPQGYDEPARHDDYSRQRRRYGKQYGYKRYKKRKSLLGELFDMLD